MLYEDGNKTVGPIMRRKEVSGRVNDERNDLHTIKKTD
jgi:hypothetical protein